MINYIKEDTCVDTSSRAEISNQFIKSREYGYFYELIAKKEHLHKVCRKCSYAWREDTQDNLTEEESNGH